jgi:flavoprotein
MTNEIRRRWAWAVTGSGHFLDETFALLRGLTDLDLFLSRAAVEVLSMYKRKIEVAEGCRIFHDKTASAVPVGAFYYGEYHTLIIAPATSNAVAKFVHGISDDLVTNVFAHAGKTRVPIIVFACDTAPELLTMAPKGPVMVYPRPVDLENRERLGRSMGVTVVDSPTELAQTVAARRVDLDL